LDGTIKVLRFYYKLQCERQNNRYKTERSEPLQGCFRQHLQFFVHHDLINPTTAIRA